MISPEERFPAVSMYGTGSGAGLLQAAMDGAGVPHASVCKKNTHCRC